MMKSTGFLFLLNDTFKTNVKPVHEKFKFTLFLNLIGILLFFSLAENEINKHFWKLQKQIYNILCKMYEIPFTLYGLIRIILFSLITQKTKNISLI